MNSSRPCEPQEFLDRAINFQGNDCLVWPFIKEPFDHREVCLAFHGEPPCDDFFASQVCDNPLCVNTKHIYWGWLYRDQDA